MQTSEKMSYMLKDIIQYIMQPKIRYAPEIGTYVSYDIAAYDCFERDIVSVIWDVTSDRNLAIRMCERFNRYQLSLCHLEDAILDMLNEVSPTT
jgi:hypothetical protein